MSLREACNKILKADCVDLAQRLYRGQRRGISATEDVHCALCGGHIIGRNVASGLVVFGCHHIYHQRCIKGASQAAADAAVAGPKIPLANPPQPAVEQVNPNEKLWCTVCTNQTKSQNKKGA
jgi:hypothetical protein